MYIYAIIAHRSARKQLSLSGTFTLILSLCIISPTYAISILQDHVHHHCSSIAYYLSSRIITKIPKISSVYDTDRLLADFCFFSIARALTRAPARTAQSSAITWIRGLSTRVPHLQPALRTFMAAAHRLIISLQRALQRREKHLCHRQ